MHEKVACVGKTQSPSPPTKEEKLQMSHRAHTCEISISDREWGCEPCVSWRSLCQILSPPAQTLLACAREGELPSPASSRTLRTFHLTGSSSLPAAGGQGGTELFRARAAFSQHRELQHLSTGTDRLHSLFAPSCSSFSGSCHCQTASHGKESTQIPGFRTYSHSRSRRRRLQNVHHHQHSSH